jgi:glycosyltransferase involved in cell wall biosynthesis
VTRARLDTLRVAVVTSQLQPGSNDLWDAAAPGVADLIVIGARSQYQPEVGEPPRVALHSVDAGRGLIWQHLVGLRRHLRSFRPDLIHVNRELWAIVAQELVGTNTSVVVHGAENLWEHGNAIERRVRDRLIDRAVPRLAGYASWNGAGADHVRSLGAGLGRPELPTVILPAIIPPEPFKRASWRPPPSKPDGALNVLLVGRPVRAKGFHLVIEAAAQITGSRVRLTLCGEGPELPDLRRQAQALGVELDCRGHLAERELAELMSAAHVLVQPSVTTPSWAEQFGRSVAEAMTVGLPCLVSDSGELPHVVGVEQAVFRERDAVELARRLEALARDHAGLAELSALQRPAAARYSPEQASWRLLEFWAECYSSV